MATNKEESYYKLLNTTAKISQRRIKEKYIEAVKEHPPETDPEQFQKIREAYDTLKDPVKRKQYDLHRKYGGKVEKLMSEASLAVENRDLSKAERLFDDLSKLVPEEGSPYIGLMHVNILKGDLDKAHEFFDKTLENLNALADPEDNIPFIYAIFGAMLLHEEYVDKAGEILETGLAKYPEAAPILLDKLNIYYLDTEQHEKAFSTLESYIPSPDHAEIQDIDMYIDWCLLLNPTGDWSRLSKIQSQFKKFLNKLSDHEEREEAYHILMSEYEEAYEAQSYRLADIFLSFAKVVAPEPNIISEKLKNLKRLARVDKDMSRLLYDTNIFPYVQYDAIKLFYDEEDHPILQQFDMLFQESGFMEIEEKDELFAAGILRLKKKYPAIYKHFQEHWDDRFEELTVGFNREMKRELRKMM